MKTKKINVWKLAVAIVKGLGPLIRSLGKDSPGGQKITPDEVDEILGHLILVGEEFLSDHVAD